MWSSFFYLTSNVSRISNINCSVQTVPLILYELWTNTSPANLIIVFLFVFYSAQLLACYLKWWPWWTLHWLFHWHCFHCEHMKAWCCLSKLQASERETLCFGQTEREKHCFWSVNLHYAVRFILLFHLPTVAQTTLSNGFRWQQNLLLPNSWSLQKPFTHSKIRL